jgi:hypothetical protein
LQGTVDLAGAGCHSVLKRVWCGAGVLTPSAAFGLVLHDRLKNSEFTIEVEEVPVDEKKRKKTA